MPAKKKAEKKSETAKAEPKVEKPKKDNKASLTKKLVDAGYSLTEGLSVSDLKGLLETRSNLYWIVRLARPPNAYLIEKGISNKKTVYALPDCENSEAILRSRRLVILKRTPTLSNNAVIIVAPSGDENDGSNE